MKIKIDNRSEANYLPHLVDNLAGKEILIPELGKNYNELSRGDLLSEVKKLHKGKKDKFLRIKDYYQNLWESSGQKYLNEMERIFENKLKRNKVAYIVPSLRINIADVLGRKNMFIVAEETQQVPLDFIFFHELTHLYYSDMLHKLNRGRALNSPMVESIDHLILFKSPINKLFEGIDYKDIGFVKQNRFYMKKLESLWKKRKDFDSFLEEAIKINDKFGGNVIY